MHVANLHFKSFKCFRRMLQVLHVDVIKVDLDIAMLHMFYTNVASILSRCYIFSERFECSMKHETDIAADFFAHH